MSWLRRVRLWVFGDPVAEFSPCPKFCPPSCHGISPETIAKLREKP